MRIRTKVWLLVAFSVALTAGIALWLHIHLMRRELLRRSEQLAMEVTADLVQGLERLSPDAEDRDLAITLNSYLYRYSAIQRLQLRVDRDTSTSPSFRIVAPRGEQMQINRTPPVPSYRQNKHEYFRGTGGG